MSRPKGRRSVYLRGTAFASESVVTPSLFGAILKWGIYRVIVLRNNVKRGVVTIAHTHTRAYYTRAYNYTANNYTQSFHGPLNHENHKNITRHKIPAIMV